MFNFFKREKKKKPDCKHIWHDVGKQLITDVDLLGNVRKYVMVTIYCPKCDELEFVRFAAWEIIQNRQKVRDQYDKQIEEEMSNEIY